jgi:hypothetical protein
MPVDPITGQLDAVLTAYSAGYRIPILLSDIFFPRVPVGEQSGRYYIFGREDQQLLQQDLRGKGAPAQQIIGGLSDDGYFCSSHALAAVITAEDEKNSKIGDLRQRRARTIMNKLLLHKEKRFADLVTDTSKVTQNVTLAGADQWNNFDTSKPITNVEAAKSVIRQSGIEPNYGAMGEDVYKQLIVHPSIVDRYKGIRPGSLGAAQLAEVFGIPNLYVVRAVSVDKAGAASFLFGKSLFLCFVDPNAGTEDPSFGKTFVWESAPGTVGGIGTLTGPINVASAKSQEVSTDFYYDQKATFAASGYLIKNAVA